MKKTPPSESKKELALRKLCKNKYDRVVIGKYGTDAAVVDVYRVLNAFEVKDAALQHLIKKALCVGLRGHKDTRQDLVDIVESAQQALVAYDDAQTPKK